MKNILFLLVVLTSFVSWSQSETEITEPKKNEISINAFNLVVFKKIDISYERNINKVNSAGVTLSQQLGDENLGFYESDSYSFSLIPYYRHFFSKHYAQGFFMEAFTSYNSGEARVFHYDNYESYYTQTKYREIAIGVSLGLKLVSTGGFLGEIHAGVGRNILSDIAPEIIGRASISFGYRF